MITIIIINGVGDDANAMDAEEDSGGDGGESESGESGESGQRSAIVSPLRSSPKV